MRSGEENQRQGGGKIIKGYGIIYTPAEKAFGGYVVILSFIAFAAGKIMDACACACARATVRVRRVCGVLQPKKIR